MKKLDAAPNPFASRFERCFVPAGLDNYMIDEAVNNVDVLVAMGGRMQSQSCGSQRRRLGTNFWLVPVLSVAGPECMPYL